MTALEQERAVFDIFANEEFTELLEKPPVEFEDFMVIDMTLTALGFTEMKQKRYNDYYKIVREKAIKKHGLPENADVEMCLIKRPVYIESIRLKNDFLANIKSRGMLKILYRNSISID